MKGRNRASRVVRGCLALVMAAGVLFSAAAVAQQDDRAIAEYRIKAAFLYHFCNYTEWPGEAFAAPGDPLIIGVAGPDMVVEQVRQTVTGRFVHGRPVIVRAIQPGEPPEGLHVLYVTKHVQADAFTSLADDAPLLTVTESDGALNGSGIINFVIEDDKVRFDIAPETARLRNLVIRAQLLTVARHVAEGAS